MRSGARGARHPERVGTLSLHPIRHSTGAGTERDDPVRDCGRAVAALVHAVGSELGIADDVINAAFDAALLEESGGPAPSHEIVVAAPDGASVVLRHLGERWDGNGTPDGLAGEAIPLGSRLLRVASEYVRLKAGCLRSRQFDDGEARRWIEFASGKRFEPRIVEALFRWVDRVEAGASTPTRPK